MIINRINYEEYFLLYTDNELDEAERKAVERFVEENPDLKNELIGFQHVILQADAEIKFPGKKELLSSNASLSIINNDNYSEYFLLYADNELSNQDKALVEQYVYHHPELQGEFELLLKVKMEADHTIIFEHKQLLMRQVEKVKVMPGWWKITASVAAAVILVLFGYLNYNGDNDITPGPIFSQGIKTNSDSQQKKTPLIVIENKVESPALNNGDEMADHSEAEERIADQAKPVTSSDATRARPGESTFTPGPQKQDQAPVSENIQQMQPRELQTAELPNEVENQVAISVDNVQSLHEENLQLKASAVLTVAPVEAPESTLSIAGIPVTSKSRVGNFISKTSRFINKTKKDISTRSGLAIGKFEIAIR